MGRFLEEDPIENPNLYVYCSNNPLIYTDPSGLRELIEGEPGTASEFSVIRDENSVSGYHIVNGGNVCPNPVSKDIWNTLYTGDWRYWDSNPVLSEENLKKYPQVLAGVEKEVLAFYNPEYLTYLQREGAIWIMMPSVASSGYYLIADILERSYFTLSPNQNAASGQPVARYIYDARTGQYRDVLTGRFVSPNDLPWPPNGGFATTPTVTTLKPGTVIDRYGKPSGRYAGTPGATISERGMAPGSEDMPYTKYVVLKPIPQTLVGSAAPVGAFAASGGATQYLLPKTIDYLVKNGYIAVVR